jgi:hypothetical protein
MGGLDLFWGLLLRLKVMGLVGLGGCLGGIGGCGIEGKAQNAASGSSWAASGSGVGDVCRGGW